MENSVLEGGLLGSTDVCVPCVEGGGERAGGNADQRNLALLELLEVLLQTTRAVGLLNLNDVVSKEHLVLRLSLESSLH